MNVLLYIFWSHVVVQMVHNPNRCDDNESDHPGSHHEKDRVKVWLFLPAQMEKEKKLDDELKKCENKNPWKDESR